MSEGQRARSWVPRAVAATVAAAVAFSSVPSSSAIELPAMTRVPLRAQGMISPQTMHAGDQANFIVAADVRVGDRVVIREGTPATGEVVRSQKRGMIGRPDELTVRVGNTTAVDGTNVPLNGMRTVEGDDKMILSIIGGLICLFPLLIKGGRASITPGTTLDTTTVAPVQVRVGDASLVPIAAN